jgi:uncharacterized hydrophobic protein (TIGR00341 family)
MALRLIEIILPEHQSEDLSQILAENSISDFWQAGACGPSVIMKILLPAEKTESLMDKLEKRYSNIDGFKVVLLSVEASIPHIADQKPEDVHVETHKSEKVPLRVSRQELYSDILDSTKLTKAYLMMAALSAIVAAFGLLRDSLAVVIGAMVIAPVLGPNVALALATTLGDSELVKKASRAILFGILFAFAPALFLGYFLPVDPSIKEIATRTEVSLMDIAVALAAGCAGALSFTTGIPAAIIGVMVAVALLPPLVTSGLLFGSANTGMAIGAFHLLATNLICINLAGVVTFLVQGIRPLNWWEASSAKRATRIAILIWSVLLIVLAALVFFSQPSGAKSFRSLPPHDDVREVHRIEAYKDHSLCPAQLPPLAREHEYKQQDARTDHDTYVHGA